MIIIYWLKVIKIQFHFHSHASFVMWKMTIFFLVRNHLYTRWRQMGWLVGVWDGYTGGPARFWWCIIFILTYHNEISDTSDFFICNTINCNFANFAWYRVSDSTFHILLSPFTWNLHLCSFILYCYLLNTMCLTFQSDLWLQRHHPPINLIGSV